MKKSKPESNADKLSRVELMSNGDLTWDLSPNDKAALRYVLESRQAMLIACKAAWEHVNELREAWRTGAIYERDTYGGTRSNRNVDVEVALRRIIEEV